MENKERVRVIHDIVKWKAELEETGGRDFPADEFREYVEMLDDMTDKELRTHWYSTVGEWVVSRSDVSIGEDTEDWLEEQFERVASGSETEYGYIVNIEKSSIEEIIN
jgi:disulfide oxidoreductase YuzD